MSADRDAVLAGMLLPALEVMTAFQQSQGNPAFYWQAVQRVLADRSGEGDGAAVSQLTFGLSALAGILLDDLSAATGQDPGRILADLHSRYLAS